MAGKGSRWPDGERWMMVGAAAARRLGRGGITVRSSCGNVPVRDLGTEEGCPSTSQKSQNGDGGGSGRKDRPRLIGKEGKGVVWRPGL